MRDIIIIGNGPAGISAAAYTTRSGIKTTIIGRDGGALAKSDKIENYYGFAEPIGGDDLISNGIEQAKRLGAEIVNDEVLGIGYNGKFIVTTKHNEYMSNAIILATGSSRNAPQIKGLKEFEGKGVSYCAICDAFFYRGKDVAVLGNGEYALHEAMDIIPVANKVTILTNGKEKKANFPLNVQIINNKVKELFGNDAIKGVLFEDGTRITISGIFIAMGVAGSTDLARKIGAITNGNKIVVNEHMETNIPGFFAAGDCTGGLTQIAKAVYDGAKAGIQAVKYVRQKRGE